MRRPFEHLHAAHRAADHAEQPVDAEMFDQFDLCPHHVGDGDDRETESPGLAGGSEVRRPGASHAAAQHIGANEKIAVAVEHAALPGHAVPPAWFAGQGMRFGGELVAGQGVAYQDGIGLGRVQLAIGLIGDRHSRKLHAAVEPQGCLKRQPMAGQRRAAHRARSSPASTRAISARVSAMP